MELVGGLGLLARSLAGILDGQRGGDDQHLAQAVVGVGLDDHASEAGVDRQPGHLAPDRGEAAGRAGDVLVVELERAELLQQPDARR